MFKPDPKKQSVKKGCQSPNCSNPRFSKGYCKFHANTTRETREKPKKTGEDLVSLADILFSKLIKLLFPAYCYTCGRSDLVLECGHFVKRACWALRWCTHNARPQCIECNREKDGNVKVFENKLRKELGNSEVDKMLLIKRKTNPKPNSNEILFIITILKSEINECKRDRTQT